MEFVEAAASPPIPEALLRDWLKRVHELFPSSIDSIKSVPNNSVDESSLLNGLLETSYSPGLTPRHRAAACNLLCAIFDLSRTPQRAHLDQHLLKSNAWRRMLDVFIDRSDVSMTKSMHQVLNTLIRELKSKTLASPEGRLLRDEAIRRAVSIVRRKTEHVLVRPAAQLITQFLSKGLLTLVELIRLWLHGDVKEPKQSVESPNGNLGQIFVDTFFWVAFNDTAIPAAQLSCEIVKHYKSTISESSSLNAENVIWEEALLTTLNHSPAQLGNFRNHLFQSLFQLDVPSFYAHLQCCGLNQLIGCDSKHSKSCTPGGRSDGSEFVEELLYVSLQVGKEIGLVREVVSDKIQLVDQQYVAMPFRTIRKLLSAQSSDVRLAAVSLAISSPGITLPLSQSTLRSLKAALPQLMCESDASFRGDVLSHVSRLLDRLRGACAHLTKAATKAVKKPSSATVNCEIISEQGRQLQEHRAFVIWMYQLSLSGLHPAAMYQNHFCSLRILLMLAKSGIDPSVKASHLGKQGQADLKWAFSLTIYSDWALRSLLDLLMDPYDDVRQLAATLLSMCPDQAIGFSSRINRLQACVGRALLLAQQSGRADHADGVGRMYGLLAERLPLTINGSLLNSSSNVCVSQVSVFDHLLSELDANIGTARGNITEAVKSAPLHGIVISLRYLMEQQHMPPTSNDHDPFALELSKRMLHKIGVRMLHIWDVVKSVLCSDAPEGYVLDEDGESTDISTKDTLSYCWRALKESSSLIRTIVVQAGKRGIANHGLLEPGDFEMLGDLSFRQLSELRHRGAFSTVAQTFAACCLCSHSSPNAADRVLIDRWYKLTLQATEDKASFLTRRSAGLPSMLTGILSADPEGTRFDDAVKVLIEISERPTPGRYERGDPLPQVHAMNCLRAIFINSKLGSSSERYVLPGLHLATSRLGSSIWAIRNSALMLFRALLDRMLGTFESGNTEDAATSARFSYANYPTLLDIIEELLRSKAATDTIDPLSALQASSESAGSLERVFPALHLLQRAPPPVDSRSRFTPLVQSLTSSPHWHVRDLAARALVCLTADELIPALFELFSFPAQLSKNQNSLHGYLLVVQYVIRSRVLDRSDREKAREDASFLHSMLCDAQHNFAIMNKCWLTRSTYHQLTRQLSMLCTQSITDNGIDSDAERSGAVEGEEPTSMFDSGMSPTRTERMLAGWGNALSRKSCQGVPWVDQTADLQKLAVAVRVALETENTFTLRMAAVRALSDLESLWAALNAISASPEMDSVVLSLFLSAYDALIDDDEEIRNVAAAVAHQILSPSRSRTSLRISSPPYAARQLAAELVKRFGSHPELCQEAISRMTAGSISTNIIRTSVEGIIQQGSQADTTLFVQEKQNLYIDQVAEAALWSRVLKELQPTAISQHAVRALCSWAIEGLEVMTQTMDSEVDGALGWTSNPQVFTTVVQLLCAIDVLLVWRLRTRKVGVSGAELRRKVYQMLLAGQHCGLHQMLLKKIEKVLERATLRRLSKLTTTLKQSFRD